jgi:hypothetical protein
MTAPDPCAALGCSMRAQPVETCRDHRCPHRWQREGREDRGRRDEKDARGQGDRMDLVDALKKGGLR